MLVVPVYYDGVNVVNRYRYSIYGTSLLYDETLVAMDTSLLGWAFPKGQLALYLDNESSIIGVNSYIGIVAAEILQLMYVSYYFWGNVLGVWLAYNYFWVSGYKASRPSRYDSQNLRRREEWRRIQMFVTAWVGGFVINFMLNLMFPAVSPRIYLASNYTYEIRGLFFTKMLRSALTSAASGTFSAFPSGHCGQSWIAAILAYRMGYGLFTTMCACAAVVISLATIVLRYHYFVDFLFAWGVVLFGIWIGGFHLQGSYQSLLYTNYTEVENDQLNEHKLEGIQLVSSSSSSSPSLSSSSSSLASSSSSPSSSSIASPSTSSTSSLLSSSQVYPLHDHQYPSSSSSSSSSTSATIAL